MESLLLGLSLGFASGVSPGPLSTLVISTALERGFGAGLRVAIAPLLTDAPVIAVAVLFLRALPESFLVAITFIGAAVVIYLGVDTLRAARRTPSLEDIAGAASEAPRDVLRGLAINLISPNPWVFWITIGGPMILEFWRHSPWRGIAFLAGFFPLLVGIKILLAVIAARGRKYLRGRAYGRVLAGCGLLLIGLGAVLIFDGLGRLGGIG
ncbi:MAG: LysE family translocator [Acidobacteriota bacterium]